MNLPDLPHHSPFRAAVGLVLSLSLAAIVACGGGDGSSGAGADAGLDAASDAAPEAGDSGTTDSAANDSSAVDSSVMDSAVHDGTTVDAVGADAGPCGMDCSTIKTAPCTMAVCNTGQVVGTLYACVVVPSAKGTACDDGNPCTLNDTCDNAVCAGQAKDCSALGECNTGVTCDTSTGACTGTPDPTKDWTACSKSGDPCSVNQHCKTGQCTGGSPKDCSSLTAQCSVGQCDATTGACTTGLAAAGTACTQGINDGCHAGTCDATGACGVHALPDGTSCNDHEACTQSNTCTSGTCGGGSAVSGCKVWYQEGFETCPDGWTLAGDWQCGPPTNVGPTQAHGGKGVLATQIAGNYDNNQSFATTVATSPAIDLTTATTPQLTFWVWDDTQGGTFDGWNLKISVDGGTTFTEVTTVAPAYPLTIAGQPSWGGDQSALGWQSYSADLTAWAGQSVLLRFAFQSDASGVAPGAYVDDMVVAEPSESPLYITTAPRLPDVSVGLPYKAALARAGGSSSVTWSLKSGGTNASWLAIDTATGTLSGTPTTAGPVSVTVHVQEASLPSNYGEQTFTFTVHPDWYATSFEGACPVGWTLKGDWQCGAPTNSMGPAPYDGAQCIGTGMVTNYSNNDTWAGTTATSPPIALTTATTAILTFRMWLDTEGVQSDGMNLAVSDDGGSTYLIVAATPAYTQSIAGMPAWGGHQGALGWQLVQTDLAAYIGKTVQIRFAFQSDAANTYAGAFIDDVLVQ